MSSRMILKRCATILAFISTTGCQSTDVRLPVERAHVTDAEDAANVFVSAYPAVPWSDIADKLEPKNNLTSEQARAMAAHTTQVQIAQFLSTFAAGLGVGLPISTESVTSALDAAGVTQRTSTRSTTSGSVPASSGTPMITAPTLTPDLNKPLVPTVVDGSTLLTAGTALYQQAQILDHQISKGFLPEGYQAHLVTLQVNLQPKRRNVSYDAYTDVNLLPGSWAQAIATSDEVNARVGVPSPVIVYPLIIMDALETTSVGRSMEAIRQAALQLAGTIGPVGVSGGAAGGTTRMASIVGLDKNSLVTVGRVSDHTVRIRLGAENSGSAGLALVPRTYNISLVVLTRWDKSVTNRRVLSLEAITHTTFVSTEDGRPLESRVRRERLASRVSERLKLFGFRAPVAPCLDSLDSVPAPPAPVRRWWQSAAPEAPPSLTMTEMRAHLELLRAVDRGDYKKVTACLSLPDPLPDVSREITVRRLVAELIEIQVESRYSKIHIPLKGRADPTLPDEAQVALYAESKKQTSLVLRGGKGLTLGQLHAKLEVAEPPKQAGGAKALVGQLIATSISMTGDGSEVTISFPPLGPANLTPADGKPLSFSIDNATEAKYAIRKTDTKEDPVPNPVTASSSVLVADQNNVARVALLVGKPDPRIKGPLMALVENADVREDKMIGAVAISSKGIPLAPNSVVILELGNLTPARLVKIVTVDGNATPVGEALVFPVDRASSPAK